jgi:serine/threonine-protein kinase
MDIGHLLAGRYRLLHRLGAGGMSVVWCAHDDVLDREVAVKVLSADLAADPDLLRQVQIEARSAAGLRHPNVVEVYDYGQGTGSEGVATPFVVMELVNGRSLSQLLSGGPLEWRVAALITAQVAAALSAAHSRGIVHRDVKPSNVMVTTEGVKLVDFGISAAVGARDGAGGQLLGTPAYLAPERLDGGPVRPATDVYALGLLLYIALAGCLPWRAATTTQMLKAHRYQEPADLPAVAGLPSDVVDLCRRCLAKEPAERPTAAEAANILGDAAGLPSTALLLATVGSKAAGLSPSLSTVGQPSPPSTRSTGTPYAPPPPRRASLRVGVAAAGAVAVLASVALAVDLAGGPDSDNGPAVTPAAIDPPLMPRQGCTVRYALRGAANGRSSTAVTVVNTGDTTLTNWQLGFTLPAGQRVLNGWNNRWRQQGSKVQASGGRLRPGAAVATGFDASYRIATTLPAQFVVNDTVCLAEFSVAAARTAPSPNDRSQGKPTNVDVDPLPPATSSRNKATAASVSAGSKSNGKTKNNKVPAKKPKTNKAKKSKKK